MTLALWHRLDWLLLLLTVQTESDSEVWNICSVTCRERERERERGGERKEEGGSREEECYRKPVHPSLSLPLSIFSSSLSPVLQSARWNYTSLHSRWGSPLNTVFLNYVCDYSTRPLSAQWGQHGWEASEGESRYGADGLLCGPNGTDLGEGGLQAQANRCRRPAETGNHKTSCFSNWEKSLY